MYATAEGTRRYVGRHEEYRKTGFYRTIFDLQVSTLGIGTYLGDTGEAADRSYVQALICAGKGGVNFFDTAINYRNQASERAIGTALKQLQRDEIVVSTKAGFLTPGAVPEFLTREDMAGGMHSMEPRFLTDQIERSRANLGVDTIDIFYLHNPETQLGYVPRAVFEERLRRAFAELERLADEEKIRWYGAATWDGFRKAGMLDLPRMAAIAAEEGGAANRFRFIQLPFNLAMVEAYTGQPAPRGEPKETVLAQAARLGIAAVASATLLQTRVLEQMPEAVADLLPGFETAAQRAIQFTRSTPGIAVALVGMGRPQHVKENLEVARRPPATAEEYQRLYQ
ncbi:MAG TPA: aldo/keto reductase [Bryobacteraceae bacterium]|nr:aldo/keto reductase [Bryobacteraceae bacterium]